MLAGRETSTSVAWRENMSARRVAGVAPIGEKWYKIKKSHLASTRAYLSEAKSPRPCLCLDNQNRKAEMVVSIWNFKAVPLPSLMTSRNRSLIIM